MATSETDERFRLFVQDAGQRDVKALPNGFKTYQAAYEAGSRMALEGSVLMFEIWERAAVVKREFRLSETREIQPILPEGSGGLIEDDREPAVVQLRSKT